MRFSLLFALLCACSLPDIQKGIKCNGPPDLATYCLEALAELGGNTSKQEVTIKIIVDSECGETQGGETAPGYDLIICQNAYAAGVEKWTVKHEVGHWLGFREHLPCTAHAVMSPVASCARTLAPDYTYTQADIIAICEANKSCP